MQSERETHERTSEGAPALVKRSAPPLALEGIVGTPSQQTPPAAETMRNCNDRQPQLASAAASPSTATDLGDNVELF